MLIILNFLIYSIIKTSVSIIALALGFGLGGLGLGLGLSLGLGLGFSRLFSFGNHRNKDQG